MQYYHDFEKQIGNYADAILCVTEKMQQFLIEKWNYSKRKTKILKDRPTKLFVKELNAIETSINDDKLFKEIAIHFAMRLTDDLKYQENKIKSLKKLNIYYLCVVFFSFFFDE